MPCLYAPSFYIVINHHPLRLRMRLTSENIPLRHLLVLQSPMHIHRHLTLDQPCLTSAADSAFAGERKIGSLIEGRVEDGSVIVQRKIEIKTPSIELDGDAALRTAVDG